MKKTQPLLTPVKLGEYELSNRIVMAPMTRSRASNDEQSATDLHAEYYAQRAGAGLIIAEASQISRQGVGYIHTPGIHSEAQVAGWRRVNDAVHERGGRIFLQLWHVGRVSHPDFHDGEKPVAPSAINPESKAFTPEGFKETVTPRALKPREVQAIVHDFIRAGENAIRAGFDGVEVHGANGYLIEQFLRDSSNTREDRYGGSFVNRARFLFEIVEGLAKTIGKSRLGVRLSPAGAANIPPDSDTAALYDFVIGVLDSHELAYLHLMEAPPRSPVLTDSATESVSERYRTMYHGTLIANNGYDRSSGNAAIAEGKADLIAYGRPFVANPDLPLRFELEVELAELQRDGLYGGGAEGYIDYPSLDAA